MSGTATWSALWENLPVFKDAILTGGLAGALLGFIGVHVVLRRMVFASSAIAQAAALGVALSFWIPILVDPVRHAAGHQTGPDSHLISSLLFEPVVWAIAASLLATLLFIANPVRLHLTRESVLGFVFLISGAGAVIVGDRISQEAHDLAAILFGSAVVVQPVDLFLVSAATVLLLGGHLALWRALVFAGFDPMGARVQGMPVRALNGFLFVSVGLAVALCTRALGAMPVFAFSVLPAMAALVLTSRMAGVFALATLFGAVSGVGGYAVSFRAELPVGATQTASAAALLVAALISRTLFRRLRPATASVVVIPLVMLMLGSNVAWAADGGVALDAAPQPEPVPSMAPAQSTETAQTAQTAQAAVRPPGAGVLNPDTSVIVDGSFGYYGRHDAEFRRIGIPLSGDDPAASKPGFTLQEVELAFQAAIDPYLEGAVFLTIPNLEGIEVEEAYLLTTALPANIQIKGGTFRSQVGRNNTQHLHLQHFTRRPLMTPLLFGADGFRAPGLQVSVLLPGLPWFATLYGEAFSAGAPEPGTVSTFGGGGRGLNHLAYTTVLEQFWAPTDAASIFLGLNFATATASECATPPCSGGRRDYLYGADLYFKWRPLDVVGELGSLMWSTEYFARTIAGGGPTEGALYTEPVVQLAKRWYIGGRFDLTGLPAGPNVPRVVGGAGSLTFAPTEFSRLRLYGQNLWMTGGPSALVGFLQAEFSMGAHGAHPF
ncbi:MAG: manganese/iron transport system permease protein [Myxococcales bacterium]|nr:manganese/iron transport system permease protein [Myxococcales bacterium]